MLGSCVIIVAACCSMVLSLLLFFVWRFFLAWIEVFLLSKEGTRLALSFLCSENRLLEEKQLLSKRLVTFEQQRFQRVQSSISYLSTFSCDFWLP
jgi:hypothetical protein